MTEGQPAMFEDKIRTYLEATNASEGRMVEKMLIRQVNPTLYACQLWFEGEQDPESFFLKLDWSWDDSPNNTGA